MDIKVDASDIKRLSADLARKGAAYKRASQLSFQAAGYAFRNEVSILMPKDTRTAARSWGSPGVGVFRFDLNEMSLTIGGVHYIEYLEEGHSPQQSAGFIARSANGTLIDFADKMARLLEEL